MKKENRPCVKAASLPPTAEVTSNEATLLRNFRKLGSEGKQRMLHFMELQAARADAEPPSRPHNHLRLVK